MAKLRNNNSNSVTAEKVSLSYLRMAPRKVRAVGDVIKGLPAVEAEALLMHQRRRAAKPILKLLRSAINNVRNNKRSDPDKLFVANLLVDGGPMLKRMLPRARGVATPIHKKMSHVTLILGEKSDLAVPKFKIVHEKKVKLPPEEKGKKGKKKVPKAAPELTPKKKEPGFFKRFFRRKSV